MKQVAVSFEKSDTWQGKNVTRSKTAKQMRNCLGGNSEDTLTGNETQSGTYGRRRPEMVRPAPAKSNYTDIGKQIARKTQKRSDFSIASMSG
ncbi:MAG: hypothetical protein ACLS7A_00060 [Christensenellales bacterium]|nr:hypothetical protein [Christensenellales bacterium]